MTAQESLVKTLSASHPAHQLSTEQAQALREWIKHYPRGWKQELYVAWERAGARAPYYSPELQQIRNAYGSELIERLTAADIEVLLASRA